MDNEKPTNFLNVSLDVTKISNTLKNAPLESSGAAKSKLKSLNLPLPDGNSQLFKVAESPVLTGDFAAQRPDFKTYSLFDEEGKQFLGRLFVSPFGVTALIFTKKGVVSIRPVDMNSPGIHLVAYDQKPGQFDCGVNPVDFPEPAPAKSIFAPNGATKRTYRIAIVTTGEFYQHYGTMAMADAAVTTAINNVTAIYKRDLATDFTMPNPPVHYTDPNTDPFDPAETTYSRTIQAAAVIGANFATANYDLGHVLHYVSGGGSGVAGLSVACNNSTLPDPDGPGTTYSTGGVEKGRGWSGGDPTASWFAGLCGHEVGHQFSATHTFNGSGSFCQSAISSTSAYEIGSGTTIMSYNGVCGSGQNIPPSAGLADDYFHGKSLEQILSHMIGAGNCATTMSSGNMPPTVNANNCGGTYTLPKLTPFTLTATGSDPDGDPVYYAWEQIDEDGPGTPTQGFIGTQAGNSAIAPLFRSYPPSTNPARTFPVLSTILNSSNVSDFEPLPNAARTLNFRLTGRDFQTFGGVSCSDLPVTVSGSAGPLAVTAPNGGETWAAGSQTVTWSVNNTDAISPNVDILMSIDGGNSFPLVLATSTLNDGTQAVTIPSLPGVTTARIKVRCKINDCFEFFDVSNANFTFTSTCLAEATNICPTGTMTFPQGDPGLAFSFTVSKSAPTTSHAFNVVAADPDMNKVRWNNGRTACIAPTGTTNYQIFSFVVDQAGNYGFSFGTGNFRAVHLFSTTFDPNGGCTNFVASSVEDGAGYYSGIPDGADLNTCTVYHLIGTDEAFGGNTTVTFSGPGSVYQIFTAPTNYSYTYAAVNTANDQVAAVSSTANFTTLAAGIYRIYGLNYKSGGATPPANVDPNALVGQTISQILAAGNCVYFSSNYKTVTVQSTVANLSIAATNANQNEGNSGNTAFTFTVTRSGVTTGTTTVDYAVTGSGANPANAADFGGTLPSGTVTFLTGETSMVVTINVSGDTDVELDEGFTVTLSNPSGGATITTATATGTILNDDTACPTVAQIFINEFHYDNAGSDVGEFVEVAVLNTFSGSLASVTLTLYNGSGGVTYGTHLLSTFTMGANDGTYTYYSKLISGIQNGNPDGFALSCNNLAFQFLSYGGTFAATNGPANGQTSTDVNVTESGSTPVGSSIQLIGASWLVTCGQNTAGNPNAQPTIAIAALNASQNEGNSGNTAFTFTVTRSGLTSGETIVNYAVTGSGGDPANAADFGGTLPSGTVTFAATETSKTLTINVSGDTDVEPDEGFTVTLANVTGCATNITAATATGAILNDDTPPATTLSIAATDADKNEGNSGNTPFTFTVTRGGTTSGTTTVDYAVTGSGANPADAADFGGTLPTGTVTFLTGETSMVVTINVSGDTDPEPDEGFTVTLSNASGGASIITATADGVIRNDDAPPAAVLSIAATNANQNEGNSGNTAFTFTVTRSVNTSGTTTVDYAVTGSGANPANAADFGGTLPSGTVTFLTGETSMVVTINVSGDTDVELDEGFTVTLSNPSGGATITTATATGTILNDDTACPTVAQIFINEFHYDNAGSDVGEFVEVAVLNTFSGSLASVTLTLYNGSGGVTYGTHLLSTFTMGANDGTYTYYSKLISGIQNGNPDGFALSCNNLAFQFLSYGGTFAATNGPANGQTSTDVNVTESGSTPVGSSIQLIGASWLVTCGQNTAGNPNAQPTIAIAALNASQNEGNSGNTAFTFTVTRSGLTSGETIVNYAVTGSGGDPANAADFGGTLPSGTVTFAATETSKTLTINVSGDTDVEPDEGFTVTLANVTGCATNITAATATGAILNDDTPPATTLSIAATDADKNEGNSGNTPFTFTVTRGGTTSGTTTVDYAVTGSGANPADAADFGGTLPTGTVTFLTGETSMVVTINVSGDMDVESDEGFTVTLSNASGGAIISTATATGVIRNDDCTLLTFYQDSDMDGFGNPAVSQMACSAPAGYVADNTDCDDTNSAINPNTVWYKDADNDLYSDGTTLTQCAQPAGYNLAGNLTATTGDCNDNNAAVNPGATEVCNGIDDDCDSQIDEGVLLTFYQDSDMDGFGNPAVSQMACSAPAGYVADNTDCDDTNSAINPNTVWYKDADNDLYSDGTTLTQCAQPAGYNLAGNLTATTGDCNDNNAAVNPGATEVCNGIDDDCDGMVDNNPATGPTWYADSDSDGFGNASVSVIACSQPTGYVNNSLDCDDTNSAINPNASEVCNGIDDDCDGQIDEFATNAATWYQDADMDGFGNLNVVLASCTQPAGYVSNFTDCDDTNAAINPNTVWYVDFDGDSFGNPASSVTTCNPGAGYVLNGNDCNDNIAAINPNATEICNGVDDDCDGMVDEGCPCNIVSISVANISSCNNQGSPASSDDTFTADVTVNFNYPPGSGTLDLSGDGTASVAVGSLGSNNSHTFTGVAMSADGTAISLTATFSGDPACTLTNSNAGLAPASCSGPCSITINAINVTHETCPNSSNGSIEIIASTTNPGQLGYSIDGGITFNFTGQFTNVDPGTYYIVVKLFGNQNCIETGNATVNAAPASTLLTWYKDWDNDLYSDGITQVSCTQPPGFKLAGDLTAVSGDCNDYDANQFPGQIWYKDADNDGYSDGSTLTQCAQPTGYQPLVSLTATSGDCNDNDPAINPGASEICNGIDDNCNGMIDENAAGGLTYNGNVVLSTQAQVNAWSACYSVINGNLTIKNSSVNNIMPLINIEQVTGTVTIQSTSLTNMSGLDSLATIGGNLVIKTNSQLTTLNGLDSLSSVSGNLQVFLNLNLADCCAIYELINGGVGGSISIYLNKTGCDSVAAVNADCHTNILAPGGNMVTQGVKLGDNDKARGISVFPNPAHDGVNVAIFGKYETGLVKVLDWTGRLISQQKLEENTSGLSFESSNWHPGVYLVQIRLDGEYFTEKLVIE